MAFKATRMRDSIMDGQDKFIMRESDNAEVGVREDCDEDLLDVGCNVDLYMLPITRVLICFMKSKLETLRLRRMSHVKILFTSVRLVLTKLIINGRI